MPITSQVGSEHSEVINSISLNFNGTRMLTCSSDSLIKVWENFDNKWNCSSTLTHHNGRALTVCWAPEHYGTIIATGGSDCKVVILEETEYENPAQNKKARYWAKRDQLDFWTKSVISAKFSPHQLTLAGLSIDGTIFICMTRNTSFLDNWGPVHQINLKTPSRSLCWSNSRVFQYLLAVAVEGDESGSVILTDLGGIIQTTLGSTNNTIFQVLFAPNNGRDYHTLGVVTSDAVWVYNFNDKYLSGGSGVTQIHVCDFQYRKEILVKPCLEWNLWGSELIVCDNLVFSVYKKQYGRDEYFLSRTFGVLCEDDGSWST